jgi:hypothetical protein
VGLGPLGTAIVSSNPDEGMDVCPRPSVLCCPAEVEALRRTDRPVSYFYQMSK